MEEDIECNCPDDCEGITFSLSTHQTTIKIKDECDLNEDKSSYGSYFSSFNEANNYFAHIYGEKVCYKCVN